MYRSRMKESNYIKNRKGNQGIYTKSLPLPQTNLVIESEIDEQDFISPQYT